MAMSKTRELEAEAQGLQAIATTNTIKTPTVICHGTAEENQQRYEYLVLSYLKLSQSHQENWGACGEQLARLHLHPVKAKFGWPQANFIGRTPQINTQNANWAAFFAENRIGAMLQSLARQGYTWCNVDICVAKVYQLMRYHTPSPSLLHGDLWSGNLGFSANRPVVFDPAVYFGDRETDIAMTELFGRLPEDFYSGYNNIWPLDPGYQNRRKIYQLYHELNHALLFSGHYLHVARENINRICQQI